MSRSKPIEPRAIGPVAVAVDAYLRSLGIGNIVFTKTRHVRCDFGAAGHRGVVHFACTPRDLDTCERQTLRRLRKVVAEAAAGVGGRG